MISLFVGTTMVSNDGIESNRLIEWGLAPEVSQWQFWVNRRHRNWRGRHRMRQLCSFSSPYTGYGGVASDRPTWV